MKKSYKRLNIVIILLLGLLIMSIFTNRTTIAFKGINPSKEGFIPNVETAKRIAEAIWLPIYGKSIYDKKPFTGELQEGNYWIIKGTLPKSSLGGVPYIKIQKLDGRILEVYHTK